MKDVDESKRSARFVCDVCYVSPSGEIFEKEGVIEGIIGYEIKGENGFGVTNFTVYLSILLTAGSSPSIYIASLLTK